MECSHLISNNEPATQDYLIRLGFAWIFGYWFYADKLKDTAVDVSDISFELIVKDSTNNTVYTIPNDDWTRDELNHISKSYSTFDNINIPKGQYTYELIGTYNNGNVIPVIKGHLKTY